MPPRKEKSMATTFVAFHGKDKREISPAWWRQTRTFFADLGEDLLSTPKQMQGLTKTDLFHKHINALAIAYFALIVLLVAGSVPILAYFVSY
jgi:hypothetical protein